MGSPGAVPTWVRLWPRPAPRDLISENALKESWGLGQSVRGELLARPGSPEVCGVFV